MGLKTKATMLIYIPGDKEFGFPSDMQNSSVAILSEP
jgi:hypothetical protein